MKKISKRPFLFGIEQKFISSEDLYFDNDHLYAVDKKFQKKVFRLSDIIELGITSLEITNRRIWQVRIKQDNGTEAVFKFAHNYTLWNRDFLSFYKEVKKINPDAIKSKWSLWTM